MITLSLISFVYFGSLWKSLFVSGRWQAQMASLITSIASSFVYTVSTTYSTRADGACRMAAYERERESRRSGSSRLVDNEWTGSVWPYLKSIELIDCAELNYRRRCFPSDNTVANNDAMYTTERVDHRPIISAVVSLDANRADIFLVPTDDWHGPLEHYHLDRKGGRKNRW